MTNEKECPERVFIETDNKGDYHTCPRGFHDAEYVRADLLLAREGDDGLARAILRSVRGCATDSQYIDALERAQVALATVRAEEREAAFKDAAKAVRGVYHKSEVSDSRWNAAIVHAEGAVERAALTEK